MTAEVAIMNKSGLVLAADSKVTIGAGIKSFDTVTKIFSLSRSFPVALMVWGNPDFMEYPIEVLCKEYRARHGRRPKDTVSEWTDDFLEFLSTFSQHDRSVRARNLRAMLESWMEVIQSATIDDAKREQVPVTSPEYAAKLLAEIQSRTSDAMAHPDFLQGSALDAVAIEFWDEIKGVVSSYFDPYSNNDLTDAGTLFCLASLAKEVFSPQSMGFVVAGFGDKELFPTLIELETDGYVGDHLKLKRKDPVSISRSLRAYMKPFAQVDMVQTFMAGADPDLTSFTTALFKQAMVDNCVSVLEAYGAPPEKTEATKKAIELAVTQSAAEAAKLVREFQSANFSDPILNMITVLPKDELPHLAESLVALTSLKRHVSHDAETVGGPIDVALISKGDGLIWIKRKHYFRAELNPQFGARYLQSVLGDGDEGQEPSTGNGGQARPRRPRKPKRPGT